MQDLVGDEKCTQNFEQKISNEDATWEMYDMKT
jgi:hypothetical protein